MKAKLTLIRGGRYREAAAVAERRPAAAPTPTTKARTLYDMVYGDEAVKQGARTLGDLLDEVRCR